MTTPRPFAAITASFAAHLDDLTDTDRDSSPPVGCTDETLPPPARLPTLPPPSRALGVEPDHRTAERPTRPETPSSRSSQRMAAVRPGEPAARRAEPTVAMPGLAQALRDLERTDESGERPSHPNPWGDVP